MAACAETMRTFSFHNLAKRARRRAVGSAKPAIKRRGRPEAAPKRDLHGRKRSRAEALHGIVELLVPEEIAQRHADDLRCDAAEVERREADEGRELRCSCRGRAAIAVLKIMCGSAFEALPVRMCVGHRRSVME